MEGRISMSSKELSRLEVITKVHEKRLTISQATEYLGLSQRQVKRLSKRLKAEGAKGLVSRRVGKRSNHQLAAGLKDLALGLIRDHYEDFGPTLAHEYLSEKHGLPLSVSSVRNIMIEQGIWTGKERRRKRIFQLRQRRVNSFRLTDRNMSGLRAGVLIAPSFPTSTTLPVESCTSSLSNLRMSSIILRRLGSTLNCMADHKPCIRINTAYSELIEKEWFMALG